MVFGLTRSELEHTIYRTRGELANYYTTDAVLMNEEIKQYIDLSCVILLDYIKYKDHQILH